MTQPWALIADNILPALVGVATIHLVSESLLALSLVASLSILGIFIALVAPTSCCGVSNCDIMVCYSYPIYPVSSNVGFDASGLGRGELK